MLINLTKIKKKMRKIFSFQAVQKKTNKNTDKQSDIEIPRPRPIDSFNPLIKKQDY